MLIIPNLPCCLLSNYYYMMYNNWTRRSKKEKRSMTLNQKLNLREGDILF